MNSATQITTGRVRLSYLWLFHPRTEQQGGNGRYEATLLIPKEDKHTLEKIKKAITAAREAFASKNPGTKLPTALKNTLHDGDGERPNGGEYGPECKGHYVLAARTKNKPVVVNADKTPLTDPAELYSGCYGRAILGFGVYNQAGNVGVTAYLNGVMKLSDGEPLTGGVVTDADWDDDWNDSFDAMLG